MKNLRLSAVCILLSLCGITVISAVALSGPLAGQNRADVELVALYRPMFIAGAQAEYAGFEYLAPWVSMRYGIHNAGCELGFLSSDCGAEGFSALAGVRINAGAWGPVEPYLTFGAGRLWYNDGATEATGTLHLGIVWLGLKRIRPRIEFGYESHISPWVNIGVGYLF